MKINEIRYIQGAGYDDPERVEIDVEKDGQQDIVDAPVGNLIDGLKRFKLRSGGDVELDVKTRIKVLRAVATEREKLLAEYKTKTRQGWEDSGLGNFDEYCQPGDTVDEAMVDYFRDVVPPATNRSNLVQCGEPHSHEPDPDKDGRFRATYSTFERQGSAWRFCGECFAGQTVNRAARPSRIEKAIAYIEAQAKRKE